MQNKLNLLLCGVALLAAPLATRAATLISWGNATDYVTANQVSQRTSAGGVIAYSLTTAITPVASASYTGGAIYGGITATGLNGLSNGASVLDNSGVNGLGNDTFLFGRVANSTNSKIGDTVTGVFMWKQSDFLTGSTGSVTLSSLSFTGRLNGTSSLTEARWVIQEGSTYMISSNVGLTASVAVHATSDLSALSWYAYDPTTSITSISSTALTGVSFDGVTSVGLYMTATNSVDAAAVNLAFSNFVATGNVSAIPEPSTVGIFIGMGVLAFVGFRKGKRPSSAA